MASTQSVGSDNTGEKRDEKKDEQSSSNGTYECNICLDTAKEPVVSLCGHLFCWPCLHQWLETRPQSPSCPVCKAAISKEKVVPLYGRGNDSTEDPRNKAPPRPQGQRTEPEPQNSFMNGFGFGEGGFQFHLGVGAFPFGFFTLMNGRRAGQGPIPQGQLEGDRFLSSVFMLMGMFFMMWLIII